jgi:hypothetical protein
VTLGFVLGHHGVSVAAVAGLVSLVLLPTTWSFVLGPIVDVSLTPRRWYAIMVAVATACYGVLAVTPISAAAVPLLGVLCFALSAATVGAGSAVAAAMALTTTPAARGPIAGWTQAANLGGAGIGGGLGLWIAGRLGESAPALAMGAITLASAAPMLFVRTPRRRAAAAPATRVAEIGRETWNLARTRTGVLAIMVMTLPCALGAAAGLLPAAAGAWRASSDLVALVRGVLGGVTTIPGCILGGYLCRHYRHRSVYFFAAMAYAGGLAGMAMAPHTPLAFAAFMILNGVILGVAFGAMTSVSYDALGRTCPATVCAGLSSLSNVPLLAATLILGQAEALLGVDGMLLTEAALGAVSVAAYAALAARWRPTADGAQLLAASG